jgi:hypothetical protein
VFTASVYLPNQIKSKALAVLLNENPLKETADGEGYTGNAMDNGSVLWVKRKNGAGLLLWNNQALLL